MPAQGARDADDQAITTERARLFALLGRLLVAAPDAGLLAGSFAGGAPAAEAFFDKHVRPWAGRFFTDLEKAESAHFYRAVGRLGRTAIEIEQAAIGLPA